jgi:glycosyltransferase involved in cell wall biosynthesis
MTELLKSVYSQRSIPPRIVGVSIIVPTFNRRESLERCIKSLVCQNYHTFEIIIVDDCSTDDTLEFLSKLKDPRLRILRRASNGSASAARNSGLEVATMPIVAFTDDDCEAKKDWLQHLVSPFVDSSCGFVIGQAWYCDQQHRAQFPERVVHNHNAAWPMTCNMAYRRIIFEQLGGFSNEYCQYHNEDTEMAIRAVAAGWKHACALDAHVFHQPGHWTLNTLLASAKNPSAAILLKRDYPNHHEHFGKQILGGFVIRPGDYLIILSLPVVAPLLLLVSMTHGRHGFLFFTHWSLRIISRRLHIYRTAWASRLFVL